MIVVCDVIDELARLVKKSSTLPWHTFVLCGR